MFAGNKSVTIFASSLTTKTKTTTKMKTITIIPAGNGHHTISATYRNKLVTTTICDTRAIDDYQSEDGEKCIRDKRTIRKNRGYKVLMGYIADASKK